MSGVVDDDLWSAVGDPNRRQILDLLTSAGAGTATTLSDAMAISRQAVTKHLQMLDRAGLVHAVLTGRERRYTLDSAQVARAARQLAEVGARWDGRLQRIRSIAEQIERAGGSAEDPALPSDQADPPAPPAS